MPKPKPELKPEPLPAPKPEPRPQPRSGERMTIPPDAAANNDLSFLQGCWVAANTNCNSKPISEEYCFDANGRGTRSIYEKNTGRAYRGPAQARFDERGRMVISVGQAPQVGGGRSLFGSSGSYALEAVICYGTGGPMRCDARVIGENCDYNAVYYRK